MQFGTNQNFLSSFLSFPHQSIFVPCIETHVQWWSRNKRTNGNNNNQWRRSNIYTAHPADSIRGLQQPSLSAASSLTTMTAMGASAVPLHSAVVTPNTTQLPHQQLQQQQQQQQQEQFEQQQQQQQQYYHHPYHHHTYEPSLHRSHSGGHQHAPPPPAYEFEHEYHQPQELQLQLQHQRQHSSSMSSISDSPTLPMTNSLNTKHVQQLQHQPQQHTSHKEFGGTIGAIRTVGTVSDGVPVGFDGSGGGGGGGMIANIGSGGNGGSISGGIGNGISVGSISLSRRGTSELSDDTSCHWPNATIVVAS